MPETIAIVLAPYVNHSLNTITAVSKVAVTYFLSPQLDLSCILGYTTYKYSDRKLPPFVLLLRILSVVAFVLHKLGILNERYYLKALGFLSILLIRYCKTRRLIVITYQDYLTTFLRHRFPELLLVSELIIDTVSDSDNYASTIQAISDSSLVLYPNSSMSRLIPLGKSSQLAPYGGDNSDPPKQTRSTCSTLFSENVMFVVPPSTARIVVRANSFRKGGDIFLKALPILAHFPQNNLCFQNIEFILTGQIAEPSLRELASQALSSIRGTNHISLRSGQFSHNQFISLLNEASLFIMPSRLESTSLAALEALYTSVPCILTPQCGVEQFQPNRHGLIFSSFEPHDLAYLISYCLSSYQVLSTYRNNLLSCRDIFSWDRYYSVYEDVISRLSHSTIQ